MQYKDFNWEELTLLIADDDNYSHLLLDKVFKKAGAKILHAYNGSEAIDLLSTFKSQINIALIDIVMPLRNGFEVAELMSPQCPNTIFVAYSADIFKLESLRCKNAGFSRFFSKPMLPYKLLLEIDNLLLVKKGL